MSCTIRLKLKFKFNITVVVINVFLNLANSFTNNAIAVVSAL